MTKDQNKTPNEQQTDKLIWCKPSVTLISINNLTLGGGADTADSALAPITS